MRAHAASIVWLAILWPDSCHVAGIGFALADRLGSQGLNVVLVALPDTLLQEAQAKLSKKHPGVTYRSVRMRLLPFLWLASVLSMPVCR